MTKKRFWIIVTMYFVVFQLPVLAYLLGNFYTYLFDGWKLSDKFANAIFWLSISSLFHLFFAGWYDSKHKKWN